MKNPNRTKKMLFFNCLHTDRCTILCTKLLIFPTFFYHIATQMSLERMYQPIWNVVHFEIPNGFWHTYYGWNLFMDIKIDKITFHFQNAIQSHYYLPKFNLFFNHEVRKFSIELSEKFFKWGLCSNWAKEGKKYS